MQVIASNLLVNYSLTGSGPVIVLLHGWGDNQGTFNEFVNAFSDEFSVLTYDLPGFGKSQKPNGIWGLEDYANNLCEFLKKVEVKPEIIVGHSVGGAITIKAVSNKILTPSKIVLLASAGIRSDDSLKKLLMRALAKIAKYLIMILPSETGERIKRRLYQSIGSDKYVAEHMQDTFKRIVEDDIALDSKSVTQPTLLIYGYLDKSTPVKHGELLNKNISNSKLEIVNSGHFVHQEKTEEVIKLIKEFINT